MGWEEEREGLAFHRGFEAKDVKRGGRAAAAAAAATTAKDSRRWKHGGRRRGGGRQRGRRGAKDGRCRSREQQLVRGDGGTGQRGAGRGRDGS